MSNWKRTTRSWKSADEVPRSPNSNSMMTSFVPGFTFPYSEDRARELLAASGFNAQNPAHIKFLTTNGTFPYPA